MKIALGLLSIVLILVSALAFIEFSEIRSLENRVNQQETEIAQLQTQVDNAQRALVIKHFCPQYLTFGTVGNSESKIFLLSASPRYSEWQLNDTPIGYPPGMNCSLVMHNGDPIFTINITVRNDYTSEDAGNTTANPNLHIGKFNGTYISFIILSAQLFDQNGNLIEAYDITQPINTLSGYEFTLKSGETTSYDLMFSTDRRDISYYKIYAIMANANPQP